jgi:hypothetical protein
MAVSGEQQRPPGTGSWLARVTTWPLLTPPTKHTLNAQQIQRMSRPDAPTDEPSKTTEKPGPQGKRPIARSVIALTEELFDVMHDALTGELAHYTVRECPTLTIADPSALSLCKKWDTAWKHHYKRNIHGYDDRPRVSRRLGTSYSCRCSWRVSTPLCEYSELRHRLL